MVSRIPYHVKWNLSKKALSRRAANLGKGLIVACRNPIVADVLGFLSVYDSLSIPSYAIDLVSSVVRHV